MPVWLAASLSVFFAVSGSAILIKKRGARLFMAAGAALLLLSVLFALYLVFVFLFLNSL